MGEKFLNFLEAAGENAAFAAELPRFVEEVKRIFEPAEIRVPGWGSPRRALGHVCGNEAYEKMRQAGAIAENPVEWAEQILLLERAKTLFLS